SCYLLHFHSDLPARPLHSFPTRRSSDLCTSGHWEMSSPRRSIRSSNSLTSIVRPIQRVWDRHKPFCSWTKLILPDRDNAAARCRSEEHTSGLQSQSNLVCRLLLEKKNRA